MEDWRPGATNMPIMSPSPYLLSRFTSNVPLPTLYAGDAARKPKLSVIELLLYNMASLLAGVAAGYDVRMSNVSPVHPTLLSEVPALKAAPKAVAALVPVADKPQAIEEERSSTSTGYRSKAWSCWRWMHNCSGRRKSGRKTGRVRPGRWQARRGK